MKIIILGLILAIIFVLCLINNLKEYFYNLTYNGINSFDKIFYINLAHRKDRKKQITNEIKKMEMPEDKIIRIDAVRNKYNGHIGCCKSHIKTIELAKKMNLNNAVVLEDDFVFTIPKKEVDEKINYFLKKFKNYDIIQLTTVFKKLDDLNDSKEKMEKEMIEFNKKNGGIKKKKHQTSHALDQHWGKLQKNSEWYIFDPYLGKQGGSIGGSSIMGGIEAFKNNISYHNINV
jgi:hypothetical protein